MRKVYLDNAATTALSPKVLEKMMPYLTDTYGNASSPHSFGQTARIGVEHAREQVARAINADPSEIVFTGCGTESDNTVLFGVAERYAKKGDHIITTNVEHHAILHSCAALEKKGIKVTYLPVDKDGLVTPEQVRDAITDKTILVSVMFANNEVGTIMPIPEIAAVCHEKGVLFHTDAVQAAGHIPIDVKAMGIDMLSISGHKFHGPKGVGALYVRGGIPLVNVIEGGAQERGKRAGTENVPAIVGMAAALHEAMENLDRNAAYVTELRRTLEDKLSRIPESRINGDRALRLPGTLNMCFAGIEGESLLLLLDQAGIAASSGSACTSGSLDPSHVLLAIGVPVEVAHGSLRLSLSGENTPAQVAHIAETVPRVVAYLRSISPVWEQMQNEKA